MNNIPNLISTLNLFLIVSWSFIQGQSITNLKIDQIEDTLIVRYDITGGREYDLYKIGIILSDDGGKNFSIYPQNAVGDLGFGVSRGQKKYVSWEPLKENIELSGESYVVQIKGEVLGTSELISLIKIDGGEFEMGDLFEDGATDEMVKRNVKLSSFEMSEFEITNTQYARFLREYGSDFVLSGEWKNELMIIEMDMGLKYYNGEWKPDAGFEFHPAIGVTWFGANEFCNYYGFSLPTEAEWEYAAREKGNKVRYGNGKLTAQSTELNFDARIETDYDFVESGDSRNMTVNVGGFSPNRLGLFQMSGNVWEWCQDWYASDYYIKGESENPSGPSFGKYKVIRGGSWSNSGFGLRVSDRSFISPYTAKNDIGFRVVKRKIF